MPYNPLSVHTTVPLVLYENQRLDTRLKTLAVSGGRPRFSASGLGRRGRRAPFELRLPTPEQSTGKKEIGAWRSDVQLPLREDPWTLPRPGSSREGSERSHFWLCVCHPICLSCPMIDFCMSGLTGRSMLHIRASMRKMGGNTRTHLMIPKTHGLPRSLLSWNAF